jgi:hypothetical protein
MEQYKDYLQLGNLSEEENIYFKAEITLLSLFSTTLAIGSFVKDGNLQEGLARRFYELLLEFLKGTYNSDAEFVEALHTVRDRFQEYGQALKNTSDRGGLWHLSGLVRSHIFGQSRLDDESLTGGIMAICDRFLESDRLFLSEIEPCED